jgi:CRP-like cAMP-binding protein
VRIAPGKPELFIGYINEGSLFGEMAYLLEANSGASVVAVSDCTVYSLPGPWLDGLFDMDRLFGAQFFEFVCLVLLERSVLSEALLGADKTKVPQKSSDAPAAADDESEGL